MNQKELYGPTADAKATQLSENADRLLANLNKIESLVTVIRNKLFGAEQSDPDVCNKVIEPCTLQGLINNACYKTADIFKLLESIENKI